MACNSITINLINTLTVFSVQLGIYFTTVSVSRRPGRDLMLPPHCCSQFGGFFGDQTLQCDSLLAQTNILYSSIVPSNRSQLPGIQLSTSNLFSAEACFSSQLTILDKTQDNYQACFTIWLHLSTENRHASLCKLTVASLLATTKATCQHALALQNSQAGVSYQSLGPPNFEEHNISSSLSATTEDPPYILWLHHPSNTPQK